MKRPLPAYVDAPGRLVGAAPYRSDGAILFGALLKGARRAQQTACDRVLNAPSNGAFAFRVLSHHVLYAALLAERTYSLHPRDVGRGAMRERDIGFWSLVVGGPRGNLLKWRLYWLPHFLFVDSASAMASGREVYGYFKDIGAFTFAGAPANDPRVVIAVEHMARFDPSGVAAIAPLVRLSGPATAASERMEDFAGMTKGGAPVGEPPHEEAMFADALDDENIEAILDMIGASAPASVGAGGKKAVDAGGVRLHIASLLNGLKPPRMGLPTVLLKQTPDAEEALSAAHQSIVAVEPVADQVRSMRILRGAYDIAIAPSDSHPIAATLGLAPRTPVSWLFRVDMDFTVPTGRTLWRA